MSAVKICGAGILCLAALLCVKSLRENYAPLLRFASAVLFIGTALSMLSPLVSFADKTVEKSGLIEYGRIVMKALGISYLTQITSGICRDCGENSIAGGVETVGKIELLLLALPLFNEVLTAAEEMLSW
ncbi:MAG: hypothetical protein IJZ89_05795 [Clostridia bacterium]|nr:hypothetical protein [Clostridia bacterium]